MAVWITEISKSFLSPTPPPQKKMATALIGNSCKISKKTKYITNTIIKISVVYKNCKEIWVIQISWSIFMANEKLADGLLKSWFIVILPHILLNVELLSALSSQVRRQSKTYLTSLVHNVFMAKQLENQCNWL